jgi:hypothetical protein
MKNFNFTKQLVAAALVATVGFFGCQKNEMDEVSASMSATTSQEVIVGACQTTLEESAIRTVNLGKGEQGEIVLADIEVGNNDNTLFVQVTIPQNEEEIYAHKGIVEAKFYIGGQEYLKTFNNNDGIKQALWEISPRPTGSSVVLTGMLVKVRQVDGSGNYESNAIGDINYEYRTCQVLACAHEKDYWKNNEFVNLNGLTIGDRDYNNDQLRAFLNSSANKNTVKLAQGIIIASLNANNVPDSKAKTDLLAAIASAHTLMGSLEVGGTVDIQKITPGLIGKLSQVPSCE